MGIVFRPLVKGIGVASSPKGRKAIGGAIRFARSEEGRKVVAQAKKVVTSPEARKLADHAVRAARHATEAARRPENQDRIKAAARLIRQRKSR